MRKLFVLTLAICIVALTGCLCAALLSLQSTLAYLPRFAVETRGVLFSELRSAKAESVAQLSRVVTKVDQQANQTRTAAVEQLNELRADLLEGDASMVARLDSKTDKALQVATDLQAQLKPSLDNLAIATGNAAALAQHAGSIAAHVDDALPQFTDCTYLDEDGVPSSANPDCLFNRYQGISKAAEKMFQAGAEAAPKIGKSAEGIAENIKKESDILTAPRTPLQKAGDWVKLLARGAAVFF